MLKPEIALRRLLSLFCCVIAPLLLISPSALGKVEIALDLYHVSGNLTAQQRDQMLASPDWVVSATYVPLLAVPGLTASWGRCGFLSLPCLQDDSETVTLSGADIRREGTQLRFSLPKFATWRQFKLFHVEIRLPIRGLANEWAIESGFYIAKSDAGASKSPVLFKGNTFLMAGEMKADGIRFDARFSCPDREYCWRGERDAGPYEFRPRHRFALYDQGGLYPGKAQALPTPLPEELSKLKLYRGDMKTRMLDGHRIDFIDISATENREGCMSDDLEYRILYVDGVPIKFSHKHPDADPGQCKGHYQSAEWGDDGSVLSATGMLVEYVNHGSVVSYFDWNAGCREVRPGNYNGCNTAAPSAELLARLKSDARRVRAWFVAEPPPRVR